MSDAVVIITIIVSTIVTLAVVMLVLMLLYYHWRSKELMVNFSAFIRENLKLKDEIDKLQEENSKLKKMYADQALEIEILREVIEKKL